MHALKSAILIIVLVALALTMVNFAAIVQVHLLKKE